MARLGVVRFAAAYLGVCQFTKPYQRKQRFRHDKAVASAKTTLLKNWFGLNQPTVLLRDKPVASVKLIAQTKRNSR